MQPIHPISLSSFTWILAGLFASVANAAAGVLDISIVFPRNDTYAPTERFPIVFALQNPELSKQLDARIYSFVRNSSDTFSHSDFSANDNHSYSTDSDPLFFYRWVNLDTDGPYDVFASAIWRSCDGGDKVGIIVNSTNIGVDFTIRQGAQQVDLITATARDDTCQAVSGVTITVTDETHDVPPSRDQQPSGTCAVLASPSPTERRNRCQVTLDAATTASIDAILHSSLCRGLNPPADCPEENAVQKLVVAGVASLTVVIGAISFFMLLT